jgi:hypothetical protein
VEDRPAHGLHERHYKELQRFTASLPGFPELERLTIHEKGHAKE